MAFYCQDNNIGSCNKREKWLRPKEEEENKNQKKKKKRMKRKSNGGVSLNKNDESTNFSIENKNIRFWISNLFV